VKLLDAARVVMENGLAHGADENRQSVFGVRVHGKVRCAWWRLEWQWIVFGLVECGHSLFSFRVLFKESV